MPLYNLYNGCDVHMYNIYDIFAQMYIIQKHTGRGAATLDRHSRWMLAPTGTDSDAFADSSADFLRLHVLRNMESPLRI